MIREEKNKTQKTSPTKTMKGEAKIAVRQADKKRPVFLLGFVGKQKNPCDYIRAVDLYVSASEKEGLPFNIMEALGCGAVTLASDIKGHRDLIEDGVTGFLYTPGDMTQFIDKVKDIHSGKLTLKRDDIVARYKIYSKDNAFPKTYSIIKELLSK